MRVENIVRALCSFQVGVVDKCFPPDRKRQHYRAVSALCSDGVEQADIVWWHHVVQTFAIVGDKGVPVDETADSIGNSIGHTCNNHPTVTMAEEDNVLEIILVKVVND